jgi:hypothetical protein
MDWTHWLLVIGWAATGRLWWLAERARRNTQRDASAWHGVSLAGQRREIERIYAVAPSGSPEQARLWGLLIESDTQIDALDDTGRAAALAYDRALKTRRFSD